MQTKRLILICLACAIFCVAYLSLWLLYPRPPSAKEIDDLLDTTIIPKLSLRDATYSKAAGTVLRQAGRHHPELANVQIIYVEFPDIPHSKNEVMVTLEVTDVPANEALRYIAASSNLRYTIRDGAIYFHPITSNDDALLPPPLTISDRLTNRASSIYWRVRNVLKP